MEFNRGDSGSNLQSEINITPLVDVVLVLLIIFMVVVPLLMQGYDVNIPKTSTNATPAQSQESKLILIISATTCGIVKPPAGEGLPTDCRVILGDQKIAATELPARVGDILGSQRRAPHAERDRPPLLSPSGGPSPAAGGRASSAKRGRWGSKGPGFGAGTETPVSGPPGRSGKGLFRGCDAA